jgi:heme exporter protein B
MIWVILVLAATPYMAHTFDRENSDGTVDLLKLTAAARPLFIGKLLFNITVLCVLELTVVPLYIAFMDVSITRPPAYILLMFLGAIGIGSTTTLIAALTSQDRSPGTMISMLSIPLLLPLLIVLVKGTYRYSTSIPLAGWPEMKLAVVYAFSMATVSITLSPILWSEDDQCH